MIDLAAMKGIRVDPEARTARAQPGVLWGELDRETQAFGLATVGGIVLMDEGQERIREAYGAKKYNFFRLNQNIPPG